MLVEELAEAGVQTVIVDPVGAWWGLRSSASGKGKGLEIPILGGEHGDVPLEPTAGQLVADVVVDRGASLLLDLSDFPSKTAIARFVSDFAERLFRRKARARELLHLVLEEADSFAPQKVTGDAARMQGAVEQLVRRGRSRGIGVTLITQRSAVLHKDVLTQADVLIAMRTTGPHDRKAIEAWIDVHGDDSAADVIGTLPSLETGEAWIWNPEHGLLERVRIRKRRTFDSSSTPKAGERRPEPRDVAPIDVAKLGAEIQATAERAKASDPAALQKRIRELELQLREAERAIDEARAEETVIERVEVEVPVLTDDHLARLRGAGDEVGALARDLQDAGATLAAAAGEISAAVAAAINKSQAPPAPVEQARRVPVERAPTGRTGGSLPGRAEGAAGREPERPAAAPPPDGQSLSLGASKLLNVLAQFPEGRTRKQLGVLSGYKQSGSSFRGAIAELRARGLATAAGVEPIQATDAGLAACQLEPLPTGRALYDHWLARLPQAARAMLEQLHDVWPNGLTREELGERTNYPPAGSSFRGGIASLRNVDLATPAGVEPIKASGELFEGA